MTRKVPMVEVPVLTEPFEKIAIDLVGPFERSRCGYKVVLTIMDLATRWSEAVPLKHAHAYEREEGLLEMFTQHGVPRQLLSDKGSNLIGRLIQLLCKRLGVNKISISSRTGAWRGSMACTMEPILRTTEAEKAG